MGVFWRLDENIPFYTMDLSIQKLWYAWGMLEHLEYALEMSPAASKSICHVSQASLSSLQIATPMVPARNAVYMALAFVWWHQLQALGVHFLCASNITDDNRIMFQPISTFYLVPWNSHQLCVQFTILNSSGFKLNQLLFSCDTWKGFKNVHWSWGPHGQHP